MHTTPSTKTIVNQIIDQDSLSELLKQEASHGLVFEQCEFDGLNLHQLDLQGAQFVECSFADTCFESCQLADRKSTRLNSSHLVISYAVFCLKKKKRKSRSVGSRREAVHALDRTLERSHAL